MAKLSGRLCGDFQPGGHLSIYQLPFKGHPRKQPQEKKTSESLAIIYTWVVSSLV